MKKILIIFPLLLLTLSGCGEEPLGNQSQACFAENCFEVELVANQEDQAKGLMYRNSLDKNKGMLFSYVKADKYPIWMKNMEFDLDIIWLNRNKEIVYIHQDAQPCKNENDCPLMFPDQSAKYILEINAGQAAKLPLQVGDTMRLTEK